jgi:ribonuclease R
VHVTSLPKDYYHFDPVGHRMSGERSGRVYRLGDRLRVKAARVDLDERKIDFETVDMSVRQARKRRKARGR